MVKASIIQVTGILMELAIKPLAISKMAEIFLA
jgi:hypothetical protein